ncbi:hypothetical protein [Roseivirga sp.]|uniref:hypothetical protein n=1 Tax=Roseivirga sp. TaxID=1964215 RepID=UPI003B529828
MKRYNIYRIQKGSLNPNQEFLVLMAEGFTSFSEAEEFLSEKVNDQLSVDFDPEYKYKIQEG